MPSRLFKLSILSVFCFFILSLHVQAKVFTFRDETAIQITNPADQAVGEYLAYLLSLRKALSQAQPFIEEQAFVKEAKLSEQKINTLSFLLLQNQLSYLSTTDQKNPLQVVYKTKLDYETLTFPTDISEIYLESIGDWIFVEYLLKQNKSLASDLAQYLQNIDRSQDSDYKTLLRKTQGKVLNQKYQAFRLYEETFLFQIRTENLKQAAETMEKIINLDPDNVAYTLQYAMLLMQMESPEQYDHALDLMNKLMNKVSDDDGGLHLVRSLVYFNQGLLFNRALEDVNQVLKIESDNNFAYLLKGLIALKLRNRNLALKSFASACELTSKNKAEECNARLLAFSNRRSGTTRSNSNRNVNRNRKRPTLGNILRL